MSGDLKTETRLRAVLCVLCEVVKFILGLQRDKLRTGIIDVRKL
jgi:hypothetical protein